MGVSEEGQSPGKVCLLQSLVELRELVCVWAEVGRAEPLTSGLRKCHFLSFLEEKKPHTHTQTHMHTHTKKEKNSNSLWSCLFSDREWTAFWRCPTVPSSQTDICGSSGF